MLNLKRHKILFIILITVNSLTAQVTMLQDTLFFNYLGQDKGLLQLNLKALATDDLGYLWAGTEDGLHKFNSYEFNVLLHNPSDNTSIKDDHVRGLHFTNDTLWIATNTEGVTGFIPSKNTFFSLDDFDSNLELKRSYKVLKVNSKLLLFSLKNNIIIYNRETQKTKLISLPTENKDYFINDIIHIEEGIYWLGSSSSGILLLNTETQELTKTKLLKNNKNICFYKANNKIYIGTREGLFLYNLENKKLYKKKLLLAINCFYRLNENQFYMGTDNGLYMFNENTEEITAIICVTKNNKTYKAFDTNQIIGDKQGNIWIGTEADGLLHYNIYQKKFNSIQLRLKEVPLNNNISSFQFLKGNDSLLWIGTKFGVVKYSHINKTFKLYENENRPLIYTLVRDFNNDIWAGGFTSGLLKYNSKADRYIKIESLNSKLPDDDVIEIIPINTNTLWVCTWSGGIHKFNIKTEQFEELLIENKRINRARTSLIDSQGNVWLGTDEGAYKITKNKSLSAYQTEGDPNKKLSGNRIFSIKEDKNANIWFGSNSGLTRLNPTTNETKLYYNQKGFPNDFIYALLISDDNNVWASTNYGISKLDNQTQTFTNYTISDGLQNNEFNGKSAYKDNFGNFYFGGVYGFNIFKPDSIIENPFSPKVYIESVDLFNQPTNSNALYQDQLNFKSEENVLTFNFVAINYPNPEKCVYTYKLEGFDNDWRPITKERSTTYTNLDPGKYTFKVKASNDAGKWNEQPDQLAITIIPPWYQTTTNKSLVISVLLLTILLFYFRKTSKFKSDKIKLEAIVAERTAQIQSKNNALEHAYIEADKQRNNVNFLMRELSHRVKNNLQIISSLLNIQAENLDDKASKNALTVAKNRILAISHIENKLPNGNEELELSTFLRDICESIIDVLSDDSSLKFKVVFSLEKDIVLKAETIRLLGLILNELITNTTKYAFETFNPENTLTISCHLNTNVLSIIIKDNGKGYESENSTTRNSLGIELVKEMVDQLNGTLQIKPTKGTENIIKIPL